MIVDDNMTQCEGMLFFPEAERPEDFPYDCALWPAAKPAQTVSAGNK